VTHSETILEAFLKSLLGAREIAFGAREIVFGAREIVFGAREIVFGAREIAVGTRLGWPADYVQIYMIVPPL
jgi:hypothetical protein